VTSEGVTTPARREIRVATGSGSIRVLAEPRDDVDAEHAVIAVEGDVVKVAGRRGSSSITVRVPEDSDVVVGTRSGAVELTGRVGSLRVQAMSGNVNADHAASVDIRTMSSSIHVVRCDGMCRVKTKSGSAHVESAAEVDVAIGSGSIDIDHVDHGGRARSISGSVRVSIGGHDQMEAETMSGSITITVPHECRPNVRAQSHSRTTNISVPAGDDCLVLAKTMSGVITVRSA
jgi:DUF4097 and DUF4098 domain-containing protein YvlB